MNVYKRVVVTGIGMVTPLGVKTDSIWNNIINGQSGVLRNNEFDGLTSSICAKVSGLDLHNYLDEKQIKRMDPFVQYGLIASKIAFNDSNIDFNTSLKDRIGVAVGSGIGGITTTTNNYDKFIKSPSKKVSPFFVPSAISNMLPGEISINLGLEGPNFSVVTACSTGSHNIIMASKLLQMGDVDIMIAGGSEMATTPLCMSGFAACRALSTRNEEPSKASRPWDVSRDGFVMGEGAGIVVLETLESAEKRGAKIYAEIVGTGMSSDAYHITKPEENGKGAITSMKLALKSASISPDKIDYINAHGTSTPIGDKIEVSAVKNVFQNHSKSLLMSSTKSMTGHLLGAAGSVEAIFSILSMNNSIAPPTINLDNISDDCAGINLCPHKAVHSNINYSMNNSFGFGGTNSSIIFKKYI